MLGSCETPFQDRVVRRGTSAYPLQVAELHDPPSLLRVRGASLACLDRPMVAVVGARSCSGYGRLVATRIGSALAAAGVVVVSGLARGIDSAAHRGALESGGATIAVLGSGVDVVYPRRNEQLAQEIQQDGLLVSEYPHGTPAAPFRFPARNRIIAALSMATVVVEAGKGSGALITTDFALELGRDVFAVPGELTSARAAGSNALLHQGATPIVSVSEFLADLGVAPTASADVTSTQHQLSANETIVLEAIVDGPQSLDELGRRLKLDQGSLASAITALELAGVVQEDDGLFRSTTV